MLLKHDYNHIYFKILFYKINSVELEIIRLGELFFFLNIKPNWEY